ncbi:M56 family metallopeptidase [Lacinutrix sp. MEBiC02595]
MEIALLKSSLCLLAFIAFYKVFLEQTSNHHFKRMYLIGVVLVSVGIPFITFIEYIEPQNIVNNFTGFPPFQEIQNPDLIESTSYIPIILWCIYGIGVLLFSIRFIYSLTGILIKIKRNPKQKTSRFISVLLKDLVIPHTFFNYIFLNKIKFENNEIPKEVLLHEQTHALQKHSADILFIEVLQIIFWFHPLVYLLKKDIKLNHEFLADQAVINQGIESTTYQKTLLSFSSNQQELTLEHAINYSSIKKRFTVMKTQTSKQTFWLRSLLLLPLLAILIFSFSTTKQVEKEADTNDQISFEVIHNSEDLELFITKDLNIFVNNKPTTLENLQNTLKEFHPKLTFEDKQKTVVVTIKLEDNLEMGFLTDVKEKLRRAGYSKINITSTNTASEKQQTIPTINKIPCDGCTVNLSKEGIENLILGTTTNQEIKSFLFKIAGKPTVKITGNSLNKSAKIQLKDLEKGTMVQLFSIKTTTESFQPILIHLLAKGDKNYSNSPKVKKGEISDIPPPPNPPKVKKGEASLIPPPPPPVPSNATPEQKAKYEKIHEEYNKKYTIENGGVREQIPPPPPPPKSPIDHVIEMAKENADFYYEGKKITSDEAIEIVKNDDDLSISTQTKNVERPMVNITTQPVITDDNGKVITKVETIQEVKSNTQKNRNGYVVINGTSYFYTVKNKKITYFNRYGKKVNEKGVLLN